MLKKHPENWNTSEPLTILPKQAWLDYKEKFKTLTKKLRLDSPEREYPVIISGIPDNITKTQIEDSLLIKPWKIHYKPASNKALLVFSLESNKNAVLKIQPRIYGNVVTYSNP